jgi:hypothetical protein
LNDVACRAESDKEYRHLSPQHACPQPPLARAKSELAGRDETSLCSSRNLQVNLQTLFLSVHATRHTVALAPSIAIAAPVLGGLESVRVVCFTAAAALATLVHLKLQYDHSPRSA